MPMTLSEKILAKASGLASAKAGDVVEPALPLFAGEVLFHVRPHLLVIAGGDPGLAQFLGGEADDEAVVPGGRIALVGGEEFEELDLDEALLAGHDGRKDFREDALDFGFVAGGHLQVAMKLNGHGG